MMFHAVGLNNTANRTRYNDVLVVSIMTVNQKKSFVKGCPIGTDHVAVERAVFEFDAIGARARRPQPRPRPFDRSTSSQPETRDGTVLCCVSVLMLFLTVVVVLGSVLQSVSPAVTRRLMRELSELKRNPPEGIRVITSEENMLDVTGIIEGPGEHVVFR